jgi:hypothetical protein
MIMIIIIIIAIIIIIIVSPTDYFVIQGRRQAPSIISICISKTHKRTRKVREQFRFIQIYS